MNGIKNETDLTEQVGLVEQMVAQGVQAIVIAPADSKALIPSPEAGQRRGGFWSSTSTTKLDAETLKIAGLQVPFVGPDEPRRSQGRGRSAGEETQGRR